MNNINLFTLCCLNVQHALVPFSKSINVRSAVSFVPRNAVNLNVVNVWRSDSFRNVVVNRTYVELQNDTTL